VPWTSRRSGPTVVVNRAEREFSGSKLFLMEVRFACVWFKFCAPVSPTFSSPTAAAGRGFASTGTSILNSLISWSAIFRRSDDLRGDNVLIYIQLIH
jgi:hypothetical protein